jgi:hypothetical protein
MSKNAPAFSSDGAWHQFHVRGLLSFTLACSLYLSLIVALRDVFRWSDAWSRYPFPYAAAVLIPVVWFAFWWLYGKWGLRHAIIVHVSGPIIFPGLVLLLGGIATLTWMIYNLADNRPLRPVVDDVFDVGGTLLLSVYYGFTVSSLVSFPASIAMWLHLATKSTQVRTFTPPSY